MNTKNKIPSIYLSQPYHKNLRTAFFVYDLTGVGKATDYWIFSTANKQKREYNLIVTDDLLASDVVLIPNPVSVIHQDFGSYLQEEKSKALSVQKPIVLFVGGDFSHALNLDGFVVLKATQYRRFLKANEIIIPPDCEDIGETVGVTYRSKTVKPTVSFCGWAAFPNIIKYLKYLIKNFFWDMRALFYLDSSLVIFKQGIYWRRASLRALSDSIRVETKFLIRTSFSGNKTTISMDPALARKEYIENMVNSDFVLTPKGDGNYSVRFFEALSLGRIPILIDTEVCLPLEKEIDYSRCILRIDYKDVKKIPDIVADFYNSLSEDEFLEMQKNARETFEKFLRYDSFFNRIFPKIIKMNLEK